MMPTLSRLPRSAKFFRRLHRKSDIAGQHVILRMPTTSLRAPMRIGSRECPFARCVATTSARSPVDNDFREIAPKMVSVSNYFPSPSWLETAVFYEIYPQSFSDSNGDGIGDLQGITQHLDYIDTLGATALWINPFYDSPFKDAGYDVRDYTKVAPRYGTLNDVIELLAAAHSRGIRVLIDLIPGHTSEEHDWFKRSTDPLPNEYHNRYIWTDSWMAGGAGYPFVGGESERDATYLLNFFKCQPALNYGWAHPEFSWQDPALGEAARSTADALVAVIRFWLARGVDGFRVDMANSLVKNDDGKHATIETWKYIFNQIRPEFPEAAFVAEWGVPYESMQAGFDMDFYLDWRWGGIPNGYNLLLRNTDTPMTRANDLSYFNADSPASIAPFVEQYLPQLRDAQSSGGYFSFITGNHDCARVAQRLSTRELKIAYATLLSLPGVPFIYYGDEIGMRYRELPTKEGGYTRTGSRTPMQWSSEPQAGFSVAQSADLYLPIDSAPDAPNVEIQRRDPTSLLNSLTRFIHFRRTQRYLDADADFDVISAEPDNRLFAFRRRKDDAGATVVVNPSHDTLRIDLVGVSKLAYQIGSAAWDGQMLHIGPQSFVIIE